MPLFSDNHNAGLKIGSNRNFGIVFFFVFLLIAVYPIIYDGEIRIWSLIFSFIFLILGLLNSKFLSPLNNLWFKFGIFLGKIVSPFIMGMIFFFCGNAYSFNYEIIKKRCSKFEI